jgi:hypothetical protein
MKIFAPRAKTTTNCKKRANRNRFKRRCLSFISFSIIIVSIIRNM